MPCTVLGDVADLSCRSPPLWSLCIPGALGEDHTGYSNKENSAPGMLCCVAITGQDSGSCSCDVVSRRGSAPKDMGMSGFPFCRVSEGRLADWGLRPRKFHHMRLLPYLIFLLFTHGILPVRSRLCVYNLQRTNSARQSLQKPCNGQLKVVLKP